MLGCDIPQQYFPTGFVLSTRLYTRLLESCLKKACVTTTSVIFLSFAHARDYHYVNYDTPPKNVFGCTVQTSVFELHLHRVNCVHLIFPVVWIRKFLSWFSFRIWISFFSRLFCRWYSCSEFDFRFLCIIHFEFGYIFFIILQIGGKSFGWTCFFLFDCCFIYFFFFLKFFVSFCFWCMTIRKLISFMKMW